MGYTEIFLIALSLAMDAFAVSVSNGLALNKIKPVHGIIHGAYFGFFQFMMPLIGYMGANIFKGSIERIDHWIAFILLVLIGGNMIRETFCDEEENKDDKNNEKLLAPAHMLMLAVATSIDALAVGISFSMAELDMSVWAACGVIGAVSFVLPFIGVYIGKFIGGMFQKYAERAGGAVLIIIGFKILFEHLGLL